MKFTVKILVLLFLMNACKSSSQAEASYNPIVLHAMQTSLFSDNVDWNEVNKEFVQLTKETENINDELQLLINSLKDKHATFRSVKDHSILASYTGTFDELDTRKASFVNEIINDVTAKFSYKLLSDNIGYLRVVGIGPGFIAENAQLIRNGLIELKNNHVDKWIVDLRYNGGGDMNPMICGLAPLIGEGFIGGSVNSKNELHHTYEVKDGQFYDNNRLVAEMYNAPVINSSERVAILLSRYTISSGELVAVAFKGRQNTRFIGEETAGYTTGNGWQEFDDEIIMSISESVFIDRNKVKYDKNVSVDDFMEFEHTMNHDDNQIVAAVKWLNK